MRMPYHPPPCIIVPVYNAVNETVACLHAVVRETRPPYRILVLDDASPDPEVARALGSLAEQYPILELFGNERNLGFAANVNQGIALAQGDVVLLNSDTVVSRGLVGQARSLCLFAKQCGDSHASVERGRGVFDARKQLHQRTTGRNGRQCGGQSRCPFVCRDSGGRPNRQWVLPLHPQGCN